MTVQQRLRLWADEIRAIANEGLRFEGDNPYSARRCRRLLRIAAELVALQDVREADEIERAYHADLGHLAPYPGGGAAIFDMYMSKVIELSDEQYRIIEQAAATRGQTLDAFLAQVIEELRDRDRDPRYYETDDWLRHLGMSDEAIRRIDAEIKAEAETDADTR
jgi:hypothetical protein